MKSKPYIIDFQRQTLSEALEGKSSTVLIAISDISSISEFCPASDKLPNGLSLVQLKKGSPIPVKGTPNDIKKSIDQILQD